MTDGSTVTGGEVRTQHEELTESSVLYFCFYVVRREIRSIWNMFAYKTSTHSDVWSH